MIKTLGNEGETYVKDHSNKGEVHQRHGDEFVEPQVEIKLRTIIKVKGVPEVATKESIRTAVAHFVNPAHLDYKQGSGVAFVRFENATLCQAFLDKFTNFSELLVNETAVNL